MAQRITFEKLAANGNGIGYWHDKALFVPGPLPGEVAWVKITNEKPTYSEGVIKRLPEKVLERSLAAEDHYTTCSPWQNLNYPYQLELKHRMLIETYAKLGIEVAPQVVAAPHPLAYRTKLTFIVTEVDGALQLAMHERGSQQELVPTPEGCLLGSPAMNEAAIRAVPHAAAEMKITVRESRSHGDISVMVSDNGRIVWSDGPDRITETVAGLELAYGLNDFFQINPPAFERALEKIVAAVPQGASVLDLYGGVGSIGLAVAAKALKVTGVELEIEAVDQAALNALRNHIGNYTSIGSASEQIEPDVLKQHDTVIVDPPRAGLDRRLIDQLRTVLPEQIIYLSCNPQTQARDIARLGEDYHAGRVTGFDFYPGTLHLESLVVLTRMAC